MENYLFMRNFIFIMFIFSLIGCASTTASQKSRLEVLSQDIQKDPQAQSAIESVTGAVISNRVKVHYCPKDGERFSFRVKVCPKHNIPLKEVEE